MKRVFLYLLLILPAILLGCSKKEFNPTYNINGNKGIFHISPSDYREMTLYSND